MKKLYLLLTFIFLGVQMQAQDYTPLTITSGFNEDVIAEDSPASTYTTSAVDATSSGANNAFMSTNYPNATVGLPANGLITSIATGTPGLTFQLAPYNQNNSLKINANNGTGTLAVQTTNKLIKLYLLATSGSSTSTFTGTITFTDATTQTFTSQSVPDWYDQGTPAITIRGIGRVPRTGTQNPDNNTTNPKLFQVAIDISSTNQNKIIQQVALTKTSSTSGFLHIFALSGEITPTCFKPENLGIENLTATSVDLTWTSAGNTFDIKWGERGFSVATAGTLVTGFANGGTLSGLTADMNYDYYVRRDCGAVDGVSAWAGPFQFRTGYCIPTGATNNSDEIRNFKLSNLNNNSTASEGTAGYKDYSGTVEPAILEIGEAYVASLTSGSGTGTHGAAIWIDYNNNLIFEANEKVSIIGNTISSSTTVNFPSFTVPATIQPGIYRLRVQYHHNKSGADLDPCTITSIYAETEDYAVQIICKPPALVSSTGGSICRVGTATLQATYERGLVRWYESATSTTVLGTGNTFVTPEISQTTSYWVSSTADAVIKNVGKVAPTDNSTYESTDTGIVFSVTEPIRITSANIYATSSGTINVKITNSAGTELYSTGNINIQANGITTPTQVPMNYDVQPGTGYRMLIKAYSGVSLIREYSATFPYVSDDNAITLTGGYLLGASSTYYYFYNIGYEVGCTSPRTEVVATVNEAPTAPTVNAAIQYTYGETAVALTATTPANHSLLWYTTETGGTGSNTAPTPTTDAVGTQTYWVSQVTANGCESERTKIEVVINQATLTITANSGQSKVYGETDPVLTYSVSGFQGTDDPTILTGALDRATGEDVGTYAIGQGDLSAGDNYEIDFTSADFEITKATLTVIADDNQGKVYGEADPVLTYTVSGFQGLDDETIITGSLSRTVGEDVGTYPITQGDLSAGDNYEIDFTGADFEITKAKLIVTAHANQSKVYGEADPVLTYTVSGFQGLDDETIITGYLSRTVGEDVGTYPITQGDLSAGDNYEIDFTGADFEITKATLTVIADSGQSKGYGETDPVLIYTVSGYQRLDDNSILSGALSRTTGEDVGTYPITQGDLSAGDNYEIDFTGANFEITKATLTVIADDNQGKIYGEADPTFTYTVSGYQGADDPTILTGSLDRTAGEDAGTYPITQGDLSAGANYEIDFTSADFEITKATLTVIADDNQGKIYGEADPTFTYTVTGFQGSDDQTLLIGALSRTAGENVGTYPITPGDLSAGANYVIDFTGANFEITKATLTVIADDNQGKIYGEADPTFTYTVTGFQGSDDESILTGALDRTAGEDAGTYPITQGDLSAGANYEIDFASADFEITKATLTVTADANQSKGYGETDPVLTYTVSGFQGLDDETIITGYLSRTVGEDVGTYPITQGDLSAGDNYEIDFTGADFEITKVTLTVIADDNQGKIYGEADPTFTYTV
ncbi:MBG domain-containing protein, partial [Myroides indicus]